MLLFSTLLYFLVLDWSHGQTVSDLCDGNQYLPFTYQSFRSVNYDATTTLNDRFMREDWYGTLDFIIPSVQPALGHCGAKYPVFLQNEPAGTRVIVNVVACIYDCTTTMVIKALKCSDRLTLYQLVRPSASGAAYCLDGIEPVLPDFNTTVTVITNLRQVPGSPFKKEFNFGCSFPNPNRNSLVYKATWYVDDVVVYESPFTNYGDTNNDRILTDTRLRASNIFTVGFQLHCDIRAAEDTVGDPRSSLPSTSAKKFIGIKVHNPVITITEGGTATIRIQSVVPIGCGDADGCAFFVTADIPGEEDKPCEPTATADGGCGITIRTLQWYSSYYLRITSTVTQNYGQTVTQKKVFLRTDNSHFVQPIWQKYFLEPITINIVKDTRLIQGKQCKIYNDPYLIDFYSSQYTSMQLAGTFYLYKQDNVEVQVQVTNCAGATSYLYSDFCVCGVVVRVGRTAFMINHCNLGYWHIDYILCDDGADILDVQKITEKMFRMYLPSDAKIQIILREWSKYNWLNIEIFPSVRDIGKTSGLCGQLTANPPTVVYNDAYFNSWRVQNNKNLFNPDNWITLPEWVSNNNKFEHCRCDERVDGGIDTSVNCSPVPGATTCSSETDYTLFHKKRCISPRRKKRSLPRGSEPQILHHQRLRRDVSWKNGWTMTRASDYCSGLFNNSMVIKRCQGINGINIEGAIETCVSDIRLSGRDVFALSSISSVGSGCLREAEMNQTLREDKVENNKTILELVEEVACPGECSENGLCEDGKCICNSEYIGSDCSLSINTPPLAHSLEADGYCDISEDNCTEVAVFGERFVESNQTKCKLIPFEIQNNQVTVSTETEIQTAEFESIGEVTCKLPSRNRRRRSVDVPVIDETVTGYKVSVSNNGQDYSQQLNFIIYNTECMNCSIENSNGMTCSFSPDHCIINNICYGNGAVYNNGIREFICQADSNGKAWLRSPVSDLCDGKDFLPFTDPTKRSVDYSATTLLSDRFIREGWYGTPGSIIPTVQPVIGRCGASYPIFLQSAPSGERVIEDVTACIYDCTTTMVIKALKCSDQLTLYNLVRPSASGAAYCLDAVP